MVFRLAAVAAAAEEEVAAAETDKCTDSRPAMDVIVIVRVSF